MALCKHLLSEFSVFFSRVRRVDMLAETAKPKLSNAEGLTSVLMIPETKTKEEV